MRFNVAFEIVRTYVAEIELDATTENEAIAIVQKRIDTEGYQDLVDYEDAANTFFDEYRCEVFLAEEV